MSTTTKTPETIAQNAGKPLGIAVVQTHFLVGDIATNAKKIRNAALDAKARGADIVIFPELALIGCPPDDLLLRPSLPERIKLAMATLGDNLEEELKDLVLLVGYPHIDGHGSFNSVAIIKDGSQKGFYHKQQLSAQSAFCEARYFKSGNNQVVFDYKGVRIGLLIGDEFGNDEILKGLKQAGAQLVVIVNASTFEAGQYEHKKALLSQKAQAHDLCLVYTNTIGAQDGLVFDGGSLMVNATGEIAHEASRFLSQPLLGLFDKTTLTFDKQTKPALQLSKEFELYQALVVGLRDYVNRSGFKGVILGLSGGIDSALTLCIATDALGADKVYAVMMPYQYTANISVEDAEAQAKRLNVSFTICPIFDAVAGIRSTLAPLLSGSGVDTTEENIQARARGTTLMALSNRFGHLVLNTTNKSEAAVGYGTLYGDLVGGYGVLKDVYKTDVYKLAQYRNSLEETPVIPERVILRAPSAELRPEQKDQDSLPDYETLDGILRLYIEGNQGFKGIVQAGFDEALVEKIIRLVDANEYKRRQAPIGTKVSRRNFGNDRHYPIVHSFQARQ